jgi:hypothetical protein
MMLIMLLKIMSAGAYYRIKVMNTTVYNLLGTYVYGCLRMFRARKAKQKFESTNMQVDATHKNKQKPKQTQYRC